jgi:hypothetical protein
LGATSVRTSALHRALPGARVPHTWREEWAAGADDEGEARADDEVADDERGATAEDEGADDDGLPGDAAAADEAARPSTSTAAAAAKARRAVRGLTAIRVAM